jgi:hypothetical protein
MGSKTRGGAAKAARGGFGTQNKKTPAKAQVEVEGSESEELDAFNSRKDRVGLDVDGDSSDEGDGDELEAVYDMSPPSSSEDEDEDDEEDDIEDALQRGGNIAQRE